jgi:translation initiation factor IF-2
VLGLNEPPQPGDRFEQVKNEKTARSIISERQIASSFANGPRDREIATLEEVFAQFQAGATKDLNLIVKVDVQGSLQPIVDSLKELSKTNEEGIGVNILSADVGKIGENDVMLASASNAIVLGFNVDVDSASRRTAEAQGVEIRSYNIIYKLLEDIELALNGLLEPKFVERTIGVAEVRKIYRIPRIGAIAGSYVLDGEIRRNAKARVKRGDEVVVENVSVGSLKREKDDAREVRAGFECGISLVGFDAYQEGDRIEFFVTERET